MVTKTAKVKYTPTVANVTDKITATYKNKVLISKEFYIAPIIAPTVLITALYVNDTINIPLYLHIDPSSSVSSSIKVTNLKIVDNLGKTLLSKTSYDIIDGDNVSFDYTPLSSQVKTGVQFTLTYNLGGYTFTEKTNVIAVYATTGDYQLTVEEGKLNIGDESTIVLSSDNTTIETGETINFTSEKGLSANSTLEES